MVAVFFPCGNADHAQGYCALLKNFLMEKKQTMFYIKSGFRPLFIAAKLYKKRSKTFHKLYKDCKALLKIFHKEMQTNHACAKRKIVALRFVKFGQRPNFT